MNNIKVTKVLVLVLFIVAVCEGVILISNNMDRVDTQAVMGSLQSGEVIEDTVTFTDVKVIVNGTEKYSLEEFAALEDKPVICKVEVTYASGDVVTKNAYHVVATDETLKYEDGAIGKIITPKEE